MLRTINTERNRETLLVLLKKKQLPFTCDIEDGRKRSIEQNKTAHMWYREIAEQMEDRHWREVKAYCKLHFGVPILRLRDEFRKEYDLILKPLNYETKLRLLGPLEFPITSRMKVDEMKDYMDQVVFHFEDEGIQLTIPMDGW